MKYILVLGGSVSGIGKGVLSSSIGLILQSHGYTVTFLKIDPYLNYNSSRMLPSEHGEIYVLRDGTETDLDLGTYENICDLVLTEKNSITSGKILYDIIDSEKRGEQYGKTLRFCTSYYNYLKDLILKISKEKVIVVENDTETLKNPDVVIIELGGTIGDEECNICLNAVAKFLDEHDTGNKCIISIEYLIDIDGKNKTNSIQLSVNKLKSFGISNDILIYRGAKELNSEELEKVSFNCGIKKDSIIWSKTLDNFYNIPSFYYEAGIYKNLQSTLNLQNSVQIFNINKKFEKLINIYQRSKKVGIISRYEKEDEPYKSLVLALKDAGKHLDFEIEITMIDYKKIRFNDEDTLEELKKVDGIVLPGGFGDSHIDIKVYIAYLARTNNIPCLGICLGFQIMMIEFARNVLHIPEATSEEFIKNAKHKVIKRIDGSYDTLCLGQRMVDLKGRAETDIYQSKTIKSIFRHGYCLNSDYVNEMKAKGMSFVGIDVDRVVIAMLEDHRFYYGVQFHPELSARANNPDLTIKAFIKEICQ